MILTVTLNAAIDKRYVVEQYRFGEVNRVKTCTYTPGGKGLNVSKSAAIAGEQVVATGFVEKFKTLLPGAEVAAMSGSVPRGLDGRAYQTLVKIVKDAGKKVILDTSGKLLEAGIEVCPTMIKPNIDEIRMLTGKSCDSIAEILGVVEEIHRKGIEFVVVSPGSKGVLLICREGMFRPIGSAA